MVCTQKKSPLFIILLTRGAINKLNALKQDRGICILIAHTAHSRKYVFVIACSIFVEIARGMSTNYPLDHEASTIN